MNRLTRKNDILKWFHKQFCKLDELFVRYVFDKKKKDLSFLVNPIKSIIQNYDIYDYSNSDFEFHCLVKIYYYRLVSISRNVQNGSTTCNQTKGKILKIIRDSIEELEKIIYK
ncbi:MAG: hypothetical protein QXW79_02425 [Thermoplasmata archaeon]